ncbi:rhomboid family intramembrane serine protease [Fluctibacter halophilus]|uniref:rhomboid family intramembrane serine protease n=1 Tax=Fluctibacter halophilus TaxID=226011 RepID=UPI003899651A
MLPTIWLSVFLTSLLWCIKSAELLWRLDLSAFAVDPLTLHGLLGIATAPLIHGSLEHLFNNTLPMILLLIGLLYGYPKSAWRVLATVWIGSGIGVWLFARPALHLGASGVTHGLFFFLLVNSILRRDKRSIAVMLIAFFLYGSMTLTIFPTEQHISFESHFFGAVMGVFSAFIWRKTDPFPAVKRYEWEGQENLDDPVIGEQWKGEAPSTQQDRE